MTALLAAIAIEPGRTVLRGEDTDDDRVCRSTLVSESGGSESSTFVTKVDRETNDDN